MPPHPLADAEMKDLVAHLRSLRPAGNRGNQPRSETARLTNGSSLTGIVRNRSNFDMQLQTADGKVHLLV